MPLFPTEAQETREDGKWQEFSAMKSISLYLSKAVWQNKKKKGISVYQAIHAPLL